MYITCSNLKFLRSGLSETDSAAEALLMPGQREGGVRRRGRGAFPSLFLEGRVCIPQDPRVLDSMLPYLTAYYGNPHSRTHAYGWESEAAMEKARRVSLWLAAVAVVFPPARKFSVKRKSKAVIKTLGVSQFSVGWI